MKIERNLVCVFALALLLTAGCGTSSQPAASSKVAFDALREMGVDMNGVESREELMQAAGNKLASLGVEYKRLQSEKARLENMSDHLARASDSHSNEVRMALIHAEENGNQMELISKQIDFLKEFQK